MKYNKKLAHLRNLSLDQITKVPGKSVNKMGIGPYRLAIGILYALLYIGDSIRSKGE